MPEELNWPLLVIGSLFVISCVTVAAFVRVPLPAGQFGVLGRSVASAAGIRGSSARPDRFQVAATEKAVAPGTIQCESEATDGYQRCSFTGEQGQTTQFLLHVPASYDPARKYPLVLVLHGGGERSKAGQTTSEACAELDRASYVKVWVGGATEKGVPGVQSRWPSFIVVPLLPGDHRWVDVPPGQGSHASSPEPTPQLLAAKEMVDKLCQQYAGVDPERRYITGVSLGGYGTWDAIERWPGYFAAAVPVAGGGDPSRAGELKKLPIWAFHGSADPIVPVSGSREMVDAIRAEGGHPGYTEYEGAGHEIWGRAYSTQPTLPDENIFQWLFSQRRAQG